MIANRIVRQKEQVLGLSAQFSTAWWVLYEHLEERGSKAPDKKPHHNADANCQLMLHASAVVQLMHLKTKTMGAEAVAQQWTCLTCMKT